MELAGNLLSKGSEKANPSEIFHQRYSTIKPPEVGKCQGSYWTLGAGGHHAFWEPGTREAIGAIGGW